MNKLSDVVAQVFSHSLNVLDAAVKHKTYQVKAVFPGVKLSVRGIWWCTSSCCWGSRPRQPVCCVSQRCRLQTKRHRL